MTTSSPNASGQTAISWLLDLATRLLAGSLNMPAPLLHDTGVYVVVHVQAAEHHAVKTLCPFKRLMQWHARRRISRSLPPFTPRKGEPR